MRRPISLTFAVAAAIAAGAVFLYAPGERPGLVEKIQAQRMQLALAESGTVLKILSPPGAGYDSTNVALQTGSGASVTVTRASTQTCGATGGTLTSVASNKPCLESGALKVEPAGTNVLLRSAELDNASWTSTGTPTVTANTWDFGLGATGETIEDDDGAASESKNQQVTTSTTGAWTASCYMQSGTSTETRMQVSVTGGTGTNECTFTDLSSTTQRKTCSITAGSGVSALTLLVKVGDAAGDTGTIKVGGCQLETGPVATSYIPTTTAAASRAAQTTTAATPTGLSTTEGCVCVNFTPNWTGNAVGTKEFITFGRNTGYVNDGEDVWRTFDGVSSPSVAAGYTANVAKRYCTRWSSTRNKLRVENATSGASGETAFSSTGYVTGATSYIGANNIGGAAASGLMDTMVAGSSFDVCR